MNGFPSRSVEDYNALVNNKRIICFYTWNQVRSVEMLKYAINNRPFFVT